MEWKTKDGDYENTAYAQFDTFYEGMFQKERLLDILKKLYPVLWRWAEAVQDSGGISSVFRGAESNRKSQNCHQNGRQGRCVWHTQGSGKSLSMVFYAHLLQEALDSPTIVVMTDRIDLDDQLTRSLPSARPSCARHRFRRPARKICVNCWMGGRQTASYLPPCSSLSVARSHCPNVEILW